MHHMDLIMGEHRIEESGKGGNQTRPQGIDKESDLRDNPIKGGMGRRPDCGPAALVEDSGKGRADLVQGFRIEYDRPINGGGHHRRCAGRRRGLLPLSFLCWCHGDGKREELEPDWRRRLELEEEGKVGSERVAERGTTVCNYGSA